MTRDECLINIIKGADDGDCEDVAIRRAIVGMLREQDFDHLLAASSGDNAAAVTA